MEIQCTMKDSKGPFYIGYAPMPVLLRQADPAVVSPVTVTIRNSPGAVGQVDFYPHWKKPPVPELTIDAPPGGDGVVFYIGGRFRHPSLDDMDGGISILVNDVEIKQVRLMVRVRKNANLLTARERDRFLKRLVQFAAGGGYQEFIDKHDKEADHEIHGRASFLPWHRMLLLDLERELQNLDPAVTIPYWDFQHKAENVFTPEFMGESESVVTGRLIYASGNHLNDWPPGEAVLARWPLFTASQEKAKVEDEETTFDGATKFSIFNLNEGNPHGSAHNSFRGQLQDPWTATQDPIFFLLHSNMDRLWAKWQSQGTGNTRFDVNLDEAYNPKKGSLEARYGDFIDDTLWPWDGGEGHKPPTAPGGPMPPSDFTAAPGDKPRLRDTIDYQGRLSGLAMNYDYDDVNYRYSPAPAPAHLPLPVPLSHNLLEAEGREALVKSLSVNGTLKSNKTIRKAAGLLKDRKNDIGLRALALSRLIKGIGEDGRLFRSVLNLLKNKKEHPFLRKEALRMLGILKFGAPAFDQNRKDTIETLQLLTNDNVPEIKLESVRFLAMEKIPGVSEQLVDGLEHPEKAKIPDALAVHLLGFDVHMAAFPLLQQLVDTSPDNDARIEAIHLLAKDPSSRELLLKIFSNDRERIGVRRACLIALKNQAPGEFPALSEELLKTEKNEIIRQLIEVGLKH